MDIHVVKGVGYVPSIRTYQPFTALCSGDMEIFQTFALPRTNWRVGALCPEGASRPLAVVTWDAGWLFFVGITLMLAGTVWQAYLTATDSRN